MIEYVAVVLAAGMGKRMKAKENKQFLVLNNKPIIIHTLEIFDQDPWCRAIILVGQVSEQERMKVLLEQFNVTKNVQFVEGGKERQDSVYNGLEAIRKTNKLVLIHDGARPFVDPKDIRKLTKEASQTKAAILAVPVIDTIKQMTGHHTISTLDRSTLWSAQTPQAFHFECIWQAHCKAREEEIYGTDDASLVERLNLPVSIVEGSYQNIKITTPEDIDRALSLLKRMSMKGEV